MNTHPSTSSVLGQLRNLSPRRSLNPGEAIRVAEQQALRLLALSGVTSAPTPLAVLQRLPRIELAVDPALPQSGLSVWTGSHWRLVASGQEHPNRQRFSLCHEFKHVIDHPVRDLLYGSELTRERVADHFAACLLMPKLQITRAWCSGEQDIGSLAELFAVSPAAMQRRVFELGLLDRTRPGRYACSRGL